MQVALVGNAPIERDLGDLINSFDLVVRFNSVPHFGRNTGTKTDVLVACNSGEAGAEVLPPGIMRENPAFVGASEIRIPIHPDFLSAKRKLFRDFSWFEDHSHHTADPLYTDKKITYVPRDVVEAAEKKIKASKDRFGLPMPSTGVVMIEDLLRRHDVLHVCGFTHRGWKGHHWEIEKGIFDQYAAQGRLIPL
jgi:hypothetical protein